MNKKVMMMNGVAVDGKHYTAGPATQYAKGKGAADPCAVSLGSRGGKVGGPARALSLPGSLRKKIAQKAADARWGRKSPSQKGHFKELSGGLGATAQRADKGVAKGEKAKGAAKKK